jgi:hypothetical protein
VLYLQYGAATAAAPEANQKHQYPYATVALDTTALIPNQAYDVSLILEMPRCTTNLEAGNFMLDLSLLGADPHARVTGTSSSPPKHISTLPADDDVLHHSRRPAILPFASPLPGLARMLVHLPFHILGMRDLDRSTLVVPMFEMLVFERPPLLGVAVGGRASRAGNVVPTHARVEVQSREDLRVYDAKLVFHARFQGLRYVVYNYRGVSFVVFSTLFYVVALTSMVVGWGFMSHVWTQRRRRTLAGGTNEKDKIKLEGEGTGTGTERRIKVEGGDDTSSAAGADPRAVVKVKTEEDDPQSSTHGGLSIANLSDTPAQYPTTRGRPPLTYPGRLASGSGSRAAAEVGQGGAAGAGEGEAEDEHLTRPMGVDEAADDEDEGEEGQEMRGRAFDSGIGTSMESEHAGSAGVRRRSSRGSGKR